MILWLIVLVFVTNGAFSILLALKAGDRRRRQWRSTVELFGQAERPLWMHLRRHVVEGKDFSWADGLAPIATIGINEDFTMLSEEEVAEAVRMAKATEGEVE